MSDLPRIVITREKEQTGRWAAQLRELGLTVLELPLVRYVTLAAPRDLRCADFDWILFTSPQGVRSFMKAGLEPGRARIGTLGNGTSAALAEAGLSDQLDAQAADGLGMARFFIEKIAAPAAILMPGPARRMPEAGQVLREAGFQVTELALYKTLPVASTELPQAPFAPDDVVFFCSPSAVAAFTAAYQARPTCVAIGQTTAQASRRAGFPTLIAQHPDLKSMVRALGLDLGSSPHKPEMKA